MNLKEQHYVYVLAQCQNLTKAAQILYISQPALSIYIANLEKNLGVRLFQRVGKRCIPTYAGERYVEAARKMLEINHKFEQEMEEITGNYKGRIRLGMQTRRSIYFLPPVIAAYEKEFPNMDVVIETGTISYLKEKNQNFQLDLLLCNDRDVEDSLMDTRLIYREMMLVAVPAGHPINEKAVYIPGKNYRYLDLSCLQGETLILQYPSQSIRKDADRFLKEKKVQPGRVRILESIETAMQFVAEGLGIGFNREGYAKNMQYSKNINYYGILTDYEDTVDFVLAFRRSMDMNTPMLRMIDMLVERGKTYYDV